MAAQLLFSGDLDAASWRAGHAAGSLPDRMPYGLDRLSGEGWAVQATPPAVVPSAKARGAVRRLGAGIDWSVMPVLRPAGDVTLAWDERAGVPFALRWGRTHPTVIGAIWATDAAARAPWRSLVGEGLRRARRVHVLSSAQVDVLVDRFGLDRRRIDVVPFGVDVDFFTPLPGVPVDRDLIVSVGNDRDRDFDAVLRVHHALRASRPATRLVIVSSRMDPQADTGVDTGVEVVPHLDHVALRQLLRRAALTLTLTHRNLHVSGITAVLETLAVGRPAVATATPGMADYVGGGGGLTLVPAGDVEAGADAVRRLLAAPEEADQRGQDGREDVATRFSSATMARAIAEVLRAAV